MDNVTAFRPKCHDFEGEAPRASLLQEALGYARQGWWVIPLYHPLSSGGCSCSAPSCGSIGKHPLTRNGVKDATVDEGEIREWWGRNPNANIGIATGWKSGILVLDIDGQHGGFESLKELEAQVGTLPTTLEVKTGFGIHLYFASSERNIKNKVGLFAGIDVRGDHGYVVAPPSRHASGRFYAWNNSYATAPFPLAVFELLSSPREMKAIESGATLEGSRNTRLASIAGSLRRCGLSSSQLETVLQQVNIAVCVPPLSSHEVGSIGRSIARYDAPPLWESPKPFLRSVARMSPLAEQDIVEPAKLWILDQADRMQVPMEFLAAPFFVSAASLLGRKLGVRPLQKDSWTVVPNLWGMLIAEPGSLKSPAIAAATGPLVALEQKANQVFHGECSTSNRAIVNLEKEIHALKNLLHSASPIQLDQRIHAEKRLLQMEDEAKSIGAKKQRRYRTSDPTVEKLAMLFEENPQGLLLLRDELSGWFEAIHKNGREGSREFFLETWNGNGFFAIDRVGRGSSLVQAMCLSVFGGIQPEKIRAFIDRHTGTDGDDGFLSRFQIVFFPDGRQSWKLIDRDPDMASLKQVEALFAFLDALPISASTIPSLNFSPSAQEKADLWRSALEERLLSSNDSSMIRAHISKYRSLMPS